MQRILVTGGAGYIGSHTILRLCADGHHVEVVDNLSLGNRAAVPENIPLHEIDIRDGKALDNLFASGRYDAVVHHAALSLVGDSMQRPLEYFSDNINMALNLLNAMRRYGVNRIVFSSTANIYAQTQSSLISEQSLLVPGSPYGESKLMIEKIIDWAARIYGIRYASLRFFNVAGADLGGRIGEDHDPETHLIPLILKAVLGHRDEITIFGDDYNTPDGSCIRDYVHVCDIASAHALALDYIKEENLSCNLGTGKGYSVFEIIEAAKLICGSEISYHIGPRRAGDLDKLVADPTKAKSILGWKTQYSDLQTIVQTAWKWHVYSDQLARSGAS